MTDSDSRPDEKTDKGWQSFWTTELKDSEKMLRHFRKIGDIATKEYVDDRQNVESSWFKLNLFNANINTLKSMLYGKLPTVDVERKFSDQDDDVARVASQILQRVLEQDIQANGEEYDTVLRGVLEDRLVPGLGCAVVRYDSAIGTKTVIDSKVVVDEETGETSIEEIEVEQEYLEWEDAETNYHYWGDICWSWCRNWSEMRWVAFRSYLTKEAAEKRFGKKKADKLKYKKIDPSASDEDQGDDTDSDFVSKAEIWEIWDKESQQVFWFQQGQLGVLDKQDDPLDLEGFFPCPPFFVSNTTTSLYVPTSDYWMAKDLYREINRLESRIATITEAVRVTGVYDKQQDGVQRMLKEAGSDNQLIPVDNWAMFAEKGGMKGVIDWFPVGEVAGVLNQLVAQRDDQIALLYQVTGMSDILRGAASQSGVSATEQELKAKFSSIRVQALQDSFAKFVSDLMQLKAEIICKHYEPETIVAQANVQNMLAEDQQYVPQAIQLLKNPESMYFRVTIKPESVAMVDFAKKQAERTEYIQALGFFLQSATPVITEEPSTAPFMMKLMKWGLAGFKGSEEIEGVIDAAIEQLERQPPQPKQDPKMQAEQAKAQAEMAKLQGQMQLEQQKHQADMQKLTMERQHDQEKFMFQMREQQASHQADMAKIMAEFQSAMAEIQAKTAGAVTEQAAQTEGKLIETAAQTEAKIRTAQNAQVRSGSED